MTAAAIAHQRRGRAPRPHELARRRAALAPATMPLNEFRRWLAEHHHRLVGFVRRRVLARVPHLAAGDAAELTRHLEDALLRCCQLYDLRRGQCFTTYAIRSMELGGYKTWRVARDRDARRGGVLSLDWTPANGDGGPPDLGARLAPAPMRLDARDLRRRLRRLLPQHEYLAVWLASRGHSGPEIGRRLGVSGTTANTYLVSARHRLVKHRCRLVEGGR